MKGRLVRRAALTPERRDAMLGLMRLHFDGVTPEQFARDLDEKNWLILLEDDDGRLRGFSTLLFRRMRLQGRPIHVVYSGDTIVDREARGTTSLARTWIRSVRRLARQAGAGRVYWLLISSGYRTYRFLPVFFREFWPRHDAPTPETAQAMLDHLAGERFGPHYDRRDGIVRLPAPQTLCEELRRVPTGRLRDPHVAFFTARNAGFIRGEELACLCDLSPENLTPAGRRMTGPEERITRATPGAVA